MELPELPARVGYVRANGDRTVFVEQVYNGAEHMKILGQPVFQPVFTAEQMRGYALEAVRAERERCARICEAVQSSHMLTQPMVALGAEECATKILAAAIRAQGSKA